jgi:hypothetical protein
MDLSQWRASWALDGHLRRFIVRHMTAPSDEDLRKAVLLRGLPVLQVAIPRRGG